MELNKENIYKLEKPSDIKRFIIGGKAIITIESKRTGRWFTYRIKKAKKDEEFSPFFVSVLTGGDNESSYTYMGTIFNNDNKFNFTLTKNSKIGEDALSYKAFNFLFNLVNNDKMHEEIAVYHRGICSVCGRTLTTPESIRTGIGPVCSGIKKDDIKIIRKKKLQKLNRI